MSVSVTNLATTATNLKTQFMAKTIDLATYQASVTSQIASEVEGNQSFKDYANADAVDTVYAVISHAKTSTADTPDEKSKK